jgi:hypothetical protein
MNSVPDFRLSPGAKNKYTFSKIRNTHGDLFGILRIADRPMATTMKAPSTLHAPHHLSHNPTWYYLDVVHHEYYPTPVQSSTPGLVIRPDLPYLGVSPDRLVQFKEEEPPVLVCVCLLSVWFSCLLAPLALVHPPQLTLVFSSLLFSSLMCRFLRY